MKDDAKIEPLFLRVSATARALNMSNASVYELIKRGILPATTIGGKLRVPVKALHSFIDQAMKPHAGAPEAKG